MNAVSSSGPWTLGVIIGLPLVVIGVLALLALGLYFLREDGALASFFLVPMVLVLGFTAWALFPYDSQYHQWRTVHGKVEKVSHRLIGSGSGMEERYVVIIDGQPFGIDDTRASLLSVGDTVDLKCKREWQYQANSGWACRWGGAS